MFSNVLVPVDGSGFSERALPYAVTIARAGGGRLHLALVHEKLPTIQRGVILGSDLIEARHRESEEEYLSTLAERVGERLPSDPQLALLEGAPATALARLATRRRIDLIVMSTHGRSGMDRAWLGSVADALIRRSRVPTLLVRPPASDEAERAPSIEQVLVAVDGSEAAEAAVDHAAALCTVLGAACTIVRIVTPPTRRITSRIEDTAEMVRRSTEAEQREAEAYLQQLTSGTGKLPASTRTEVITAPNAARAILQAADTRGADIIVVGSRGHGGAARLVLGSVADKVIRGSVVPVLVCPAARS